MKTISTKPNPAFKRVQLIPPLPAVLPACTPPPGALCQKMTDLAACALRVGQRFNAPAVRLTN